MRRFVIVGHKASSTADFKLDDIAGGAGRLDVLMRCVNSAFFLSHKIRTDTEVYLVLLGPGDPPKTVRFVGSELRYLNPDERSTAALVRNALMKRAKEEVRSTPGIYVSSMSFRDVLDQLQGKCQIVYLKEDGTYHRDVRFEDEVAFVLSDHRDLTVEEEAELTTRTGVVISLGSTSYHADHCITIVNHELDMRAAPGPDRPS